MVCRICTVIPQNAAGSTRGFESVVADKQRQARGWKSEIVNDRLRLCVKEVDVYFSNAGAGPGNRCSTAAANIDGLKCCSGEIQEHMVIRRDRGNGRPEVCPLVCIFILRVSYVGTAGREGCVLENRRVLHPLHRGLGITANGTVSRKRGTVLECEPQRNNDNRHHGCRGT